MNTTYRPMTARERKELEGYISWIPVFARTMMFAAAVTVVAAIAAALQAGLEEMVGGRSLGPLWAIPTMAVAAILFIQSKKWTGGPELRRGFVADLVRGEVAVHHVVVSAALEIPEVEDEGPTFFVRDVDGETLFFSGQFLERLEKRGFPWTEFMIQEAPVSKHFYGVRAEGPAFEGTKVVPGLAHAQLKQLGLFARSWGKLDITLSDLERGG